MADGAAAAIEVAGITKVFETGAAETAIRALDGVSVVIRDNEFFTLLGPSGCGKTTLLRMIAGFEAPTSGEILLFGRAMQGLPPHRRPVNTVFQSYALFPHLTVAQNVAFGLEMKRTPRARIAERVAAMLALVKLGGMENRRPAQLSGGQQQRVALARALASEPRVLLLDEPLSALDLKLRKEMQLELKRLQRETGITFIFVTHDQEEALTMSDRIAVMDHGRILQIGAPRDIYETPTHRFVADFIGETNILSPAAAARLGQAGPGTKAVRPERVAIRPDGGGAEGLAGRIEAVVYLGTDTVYHVALDEGGTIMARIQNAAPAGAAASGLAAGDPVRVVVPPEAVLRLAD